ncbi:hypothetical protein Y032_0186g1058 [Ancylostoma ceylanicum]|uniref:EndoU domain-containing protein n=1 Tax=Ancylostoma ceylanicum TaxID=53326 RepID=A0A016SRU0_9BILA|nr:hypothetical protein Y032_0186g1058 [Ancylostoma ceylanicum]
MNGRYLSFFAPGLASMDTEVFKTQLTTLWFNPYSRGGPEGSSGFEALFAGETLNGDVIRFANWYRFYQLEKQGSVNYHGWFTKQAVSFLVLLHFCRDSLSKCSFHKE